MLSILAAALSVPPLLIACYYAAMSVAGTRRRPGPARPAAWPRVGVLVPAHNEAPSVGATIRSARAQAYPPDRVRVLVVADNCSDDTAGAARRLGAEVLVRADPTRRGKGYALELGVAELLTDCDGVLVLDADCDLPPGCLAECAGELGRGAAAVQLARLPRASAAPGAPELVASVGSAIENAVSAGRARLGLSAALRGSGMLFARDTLVRVPMATYGLVEDAEYGAKLAEAGVRVGFRADVVVRGEVPADRAVLARQRARWGAALAGGTPRERLGRALHSKPLVLAHLGLSTALLVALIFASTESGAAPFALLAAAGAWLLTLFVYGRGIREVSSWGAVFGSAAGLVAAVAGILRANASAASGGVRAWERTARAAELAGR